VNRSGMVLVPITNRPVRRLVRWTGPPSFRDHQCPAQATDQCALTNPCALGEGVSQDGEIGVNAATAGY
jgi:hypothetical protein